MAFGLRIQPYRLLVGGPLGLSLSLPLLRSNTSSVIRCDYGPPALQTPPETRSHQSPVHGVENKTSTSSRYGVRASTVRKMSLGSVLGLLVGVGLRVFSRPLAFTVGLTILLVEWASSKGYNIIPTRWLQRYMKSVDVRRAVTENIPFKATFGSTMILAAFADFSTHED